MCFFFEQVIFLELTFAKIVPAALCRSILEQLAILLHMVQTCWLKEPVRCSSVGREIKT